jgi:hypothetical protein
MMRATLIVAAGVLLGLGPIACESLGARSSREAPREAAPPANVPKVPPPGTILVGSTLESPAAAAAPRPLRGEDAIREMQARTPVGEGPSSKLVIEDGKSSFTLTIRYTDGSFATITDGNGLEFHPAK